MAEDTSTIAFRATAEERARLQTQADSVKQSLAEYVKSKALAPAQTTEPWLQETLRYLIYMVENLHLSTYFIAEKSAFLQPEQLSEILQDATGQAGLYVHQLDKNFARLQQLLTAIAKSEAQENA